MIKPTHKIYESWKNALYIQKNGLISMKFENLGLQGDDL